MYLPCICPFQIFGFFSAAAYLCLILFQTPTTMRIIFIIYYLLITLLFVSCQESSSVEVEREKIASLLQKGDSCRQVGNEENSIAFYYRSLELASRPLKSAHLRNIVRKQYPADFFNKPQKSPHGSFEVVCGGS